MAAFVDGLGARRRKLADDIAQLQIKLQIIRNAEEACSSSVRSRRRVRQGKKKKLPFVVLGLLKKYGLEEAVVITVSKLMLPKHVWSPDDPPAGWSWPIELDRFLTARRMVPRIHVVWANRFAPPHRRVIRKVKRLFAEAKVFQKVMAMNERGVSPKREQLIFWFKEAWLYTDAGTDALPNSLDQPRKCRRWMEHFKRFWRVNWGKLAVRGQLSPEQQSHKVFNHWAIVRNQKWSHFLNHFWAQFLGPIIKKLIRRPRFGTIFRFTFWTPKFANFILMVAGCFVFAMGAMVMARTFPWPASCVYQHRRNACVPAAAAEERLRGHVAQEKQPFRLFAGASSRPTGPVDVAWLHMR